MATASTKRTRAAKMKVSVIPHRKSSSNLKSGSQRSAKRRTAGRRDADIIAMESSALPRRVLQILSETSAPPEDRGEESESPFIPQDE